MEEKEEEATEQALGVGVSVQMSCEKLQTVTVSLFHHCSNSKGIIQLSSHVASGCTMMTIDPPPRGHGAWLAKASGVPADDVLIEVSSLSLVGPSQSRASDAWCQASQAMLCLSACAAFARLMPLFISQG